MILPAILIFINIKTFSQNNAQYEFKHFSPKSGLSSIYIKKIIQDPYGFMWIATQDGLNRFDGKNFIVYNKDAQKKHSITGSDIRDILIDTINRLVWSLNSYGGIDAIDYETGNVTYQYFQSQDQHTAYTLFTSFALSGLQIYISSTNGVYVLDTKIKSVTKVNHAINFTDVDKILIDYLGDIWLFSKYTGIYILQNKTLKVLAHIVKKYLENDNGLTFYDCKQLYDRRILMATNFGLKIAAYSKDSGAFITNNPYPEQPVSHGIDIYSCSQDKQGNIWFSTTNYLIKINSYTNEPIIIKENTSRDELKWLNSIYTIYFDEGNNLWLGCQQGLAFTRNQPSAFIKLNKSAVSEAAITHAYFINPRNDSLLYCCAQNGLFKVNPKTGVILSLEQSKPFYHVFTDPFKRLIASNNSGSFVLSKNSSIPVENFYPCFKPLQKAVFNSHCYVGDSLIVLGTENNLGIVVWNFKKHTAYSIQQNSKALRLKENIVNTVYCDKNDIVWILGDYSVSLLNVKENSIKSLDTYNNPLKKNYSIFFDICEVKNFFYLASYGSGILVYDSSFHFVHAINTKNNLPTNSIYKIISYKDSLLFVTSNNGLSVIDIGKNYKIKTYYESDGLHSNIFEENSACIKNDMIYAGGLDGLTSINPSLFTKNSSSPKLFISSVKINTKSIQIDSTDILLKSLEIPNDVLQTNVYFSALNYANPERVSYDYKINEIHENWINLGSNNAVNLIGLSPGTYTLQVKASNEDGVTCHPIELQLIYLPKWYQTRVFKLLIIAAIGGLLYALYRYRISQIRKQQQIRKDIASDLHDDIGSTLNTVKIFAHLAKKEQEKAAHLEQIEASLTQANIGLRDMIWVLDDAQDTVAGLMERIRKFALPVLHANHIQLETLVDSTDNKMLPKPEKRNLLLIAKESINNSIKYAACKNITVQLHQANGKTTLFIRDDGKGFEQSIVTEGNGLKNIHERARQIHYHVNITSTPGSGTLIKLVKK